MKQESESYVTQANGLDGTTSAFGQSGKDAKHKRAGGDQEVALLNHGDLLFSLIVLAAQDSPSLISDLQHSALTYNASTSICAGTAVWIS